MGPVTVDDLLTIPDDGYLHEVVEGVLVRMAGSGDEATIIGNIINNALFNFVVPRRLGIVTPADGVYRVAGAETGLLPDASFYAWARHPGHRPSPRPLPFAPVLAVAVASPDQTPDAMAAKARVYLAGGTRLVWVVWPSSGHSDVWHPDQTAGPAATLNTTDALDGAEVIPGFTYPVARIFAALTPPEGQ
jgi:Uma2 family endonuclease